MSFGGTNSIHSSYGNSVGKACLTNWCCILARPGQAYQAEQLRNALMDTTANPETSICSCMSCRQNRCETKKPQSIACEVQLSIQYHPNKVVCEADHDQWRPFAQESMIRNDQSRAALRLSTTNGYLLLADTAVAKKPGRFLSLLETCKDKKDGFPNSSNLSETE